MKSFNKIGVIIAVLFGILLLFVSAKENSTYKIDPELSIISESEKVKACNLNEWIIEKNQNYMLIDIRTENEYDEGSIPTAENIPLEELIKKDIVSDLPEDRPLIIYSNVDSQANQGWTILKKAGLKVFVLEGGYNYWKKFPIQKEDMSDEDLMIYKKDLSAANSLKGIRTTDISGTDIKPLKKKKSRKKKRKKKNKLEGC